MELKILHTIFSFCCYQDAARSPHNSGEIFPVCYRCAGLYFGIISTYLFLYVRKNATHFYLDKKTGLQLILFVMPLVIDGLANFSGIWSTPEMLRSVTGALCGIVLPVFLFFIRNNSILPASNHTLRPTYIIVPLAMSSGFIFLLTFSPSNFIFHVLALISAAGLILFILNMARTLFYLQSPVVFEKN